MARERRRFQRVPQPFHAKYRLLGELTAGWSEVATMNLSAGGIRFRSEASLEPGALIELQLELPSEASLLIIQGRVIWCQARASGVAESGVEFFDVSPGQQARIDNVVQFLK